MAWQLVFDIRYTTTRVPWACFSTYGVNVALYKWTLIILSTSTSTSFPGQRASFLFTPNTCTIQNNCFLCVPSLFQLLLLYFFQLQGCFGIGHRVQFSSDQFKMDRPDMTSRGWLGVINQLLINQSRWYLCAQEGPYALHPFSLRSFPNVALETVPMLVWLTMALSRPLKEDRWALPIYMPLSHRRNTTEKKSLVMLNVTVAPRLFISSFGSCCIFGFCVCFLPFLFVFLCHVNVRANNI